MTFLVSFTYKIMTCIYILHQLSWGHNQTPKVASNMQRIACSNSIIPSQPTFQCRINVVSTLWINVEITLIRHWKWNKIRRRIFNVAQRWYNVSARRWNNVETTLIKRCFNLTWTLVKAILNPIGLVMIMDL